MAYPLGQRDGLVVGEETGERGPAAGQPGLDGAHGYVERGGDLRHRQVGQVVQYDRLPGGWRQLSQRGEQCDSVAGHAGHRGRGDLDTTGTDQPVEQPAPPVAGPGDVEGDDPQPPFGVVGAQERLRRGENPGERLVHGVLRLGQITDEAGDLGHQAAVVGLVRLPYRILGTQIALPVFNTCHGQDQQVGRTVASFFKICRSAVRGVAGRGGGSCPGSYVAVKITDRPAVTARR
jgi:hypothetical protein